MNKKIYNAAYLINVIFQAFFNLLFPMAIMLILAWLTTEKLSFPQWVYAPMIIFGLAVGLFSMIKFLIRALDTLEKIEKAQSSAKNEDKENNYTV